jgi:hypothetical protein
MAVYPQAVNMLIPRGTVGSSSAQPRIKPTIIILHTNASNTSLAGAASLMLNTTKGQEYHFQQEASGTSGRVAGRLGQYVDTTIRADNNYKANSFMSGGVLCGAISVETADHGTPYQESWTDLGQRENLEDLVVWLCMVHGIPARRCPDPFSPGIGYHSMWGYNTSSNMNVNPWTNTVGKICPGPGKIGEFNDLLATVARRVAGEAEEDDLPTPKEVWEHVLPPLGDLGGGPAQAVVQDARLAARSAHTAALAANSTAAKAQANTDTLEGTVGTIATHVTELADAVAALTAKVDALQPGEGGAVSLNVNLTGTATPAA